ncbi:hypothetical protein [Adhaeribacter pallidiroseus]|uniref:Uncharacterized protein n=1 Tax=Adhaeribacter pallidiroseus TaxID=2072847 RepID=A0A369Q8X3_9BACT|nr:hypothetical protein [Adhaeribacter pallidiroseus]RDC58694.1 hypothetical protein AHMF7616_05328 [Adhaeribacter pallidiroseus]RDC58738.1 hypothetical protein AHMF7616_05372 [Adhaeribacter pallidiroseus]
MKPYTILALLLILNLVGAKAQVVAPKIERFPSIQLKTPELHDNYLAQDPAAFLKGLQQKGVTSQHLSGDQKAKGEVPLQKSIATKMPIMQPDSTIKFQILAVIPDSTTLYHMPVKKLD